LHLQNNGMPQQYMSLRSTAGPSCTLFYRVVGGKWLSRVR